MRLEKSNSVLNILMNHEAFISASDLSALLGVSERSVYRYIDTLNNRLRGTGNYILKKPGLGFKLTINNPDSIQLTDTPSEEDQKLQLGLVQAATFCNRSPLDIESRFYISESTLLRKLQGLNDQLQAFGIQIATNKQNYYHFIGDSMATMDYLLAFTLNLPPDQRLNFWNIETTQIHLLSKWLEENLHKYSEFDKTCLVWSLFISLFMNHISYQIVIKKDLDHWLRQIDFSFFANTLHFLHSVDSPDTEIRIKESIFEILEAMVLTKFDVNHIKNFIDSLLVHIKQLIKRSKLGLVPQNKIDNQMKSELALDYIYAGLLGAKIAEQFEIKVHKNELGYIGLYLAIISKQIEVLSELVKVAIYSESQVSMAHFLRTRLELNIANLEIGILNKETASKAGDFDLILCLEHFETENANTLFVHDIFSKPLLDQIQIEVDSIREKKFPYANLIYPQVIQSDGKNVNEVILQALVHRFDTETSSSLANKIIERENISSSAIGNGIAFPHTFSSEVSNSQILIIHVPEEVLWYNDTVNVIFLSVFRVDQFHDLGVFRKLYHFCKIPENIESLKRNEILTLIHYLR